MPDTAAPNDATDHAGQQKEGYIPRPPSKADLDQVSRDQALIADEWAGDSLAGNTAPPKQG